MNNSLQNNKLILLEKQLSIYTLGNFKVMNGDADLTELYKDSIKIWDLLKFFITYRDKFLLPEKIIDSLWPDADYVEPKRTLRALIFRLRRIIEPNFKTSEPQLISFSHGCYIFNSNLLKYLDIVAFDNLYYDALNLNSSDDAEHITAFGKVIELHKGLYLNDTFEYDWIVMARRHFNRIFINSILIKTDLLIKSNKILDAVELCEHAQKFDLFDEKLQYKYIYSLIFLGEVKKAQKHFEYIKRKFDISYDLTNEGYLHKIENLFLSNSKQVMIQNRQNKQRTENSKLLGPSICDLDYFYFNKQLEKSRSERSETHLYYASLTIISVDNQKPDSVTLKLLMQSLKIVLISSLRKGDLISQNGENQFLLSLTALNHEHAISALDRIINKFLLVKNNCAYSVKKQIEEPELSKYENHLCFSEPTLTTQP